MNKNYIIIITISIMLILIMPMIMGEASFVFKKNDVIDLKIPVTNSNNSKSTNTTSCTITIRDSNEQIIIQDHNMSFGDGGLFNYTVVNTTELGEYPSYVSCFNGVDGGFTTFSFEITASGENISTAKGMVYIGLIALLIFLFIIDLMAASKISTQDETDEYGMLMGISKLKYLRPVLFALAWAILLAIVFASSNVALIYIGDTLFGNILFRLWKGMMALTLPGIVFWLIFIFVQIFRDIEVKKLLKRGIDVPGSP